MHHVTSLKNTSTKLTKFIQSCIYNFGLKSRKLLNHGYNTLYFFRQVNILHFHIYDSINKLL